MKKLMDIYLFRVPKLLELSAIGNKSRRLEYIEILHNRQHCFQQFGGEKLTLNTGTT